MTLLRVQTMTTLRAAIGSTLGTVATVTSSVNSIATMLDEGAGAAADYAKELRKKQRVQYAIDAMSYEESAVAKAAERDVRASEEMDKYLDGQEGRREKYNARFNQYMAKINEAKKA